MTPQTFTRDQSLRYLADNEFDLLVVGGGITGAGTALDGAARGLRTALVERGDFASGTSSKSSKLVHGGLRYLQQGDVRLVYAALRERERLRHNAPHLVKLLPFLIPAFAGRDGVVPRGLWHALGAAMWMYDLTGGVRSGKLHKRLSKDDALAYMPTLLPDRIAGGYLYYDASTDDARLTLTVLRTASLQYGAVVANGAGVTGLRKDPGSGRVTGARVRTAEGDEMEVRARVVVNATGVWADDVRTLDEGKHANGVRPAKGVHVTVPWHLVRNTIAVVLPVPKDKRSLFVVPWASEGEREPRYSYIGTTDTDYHGGLDEPQCTSEDIDYVLGAINSSTDAGISRSDVLGTWAGLRPLVKSAKSPRTADLSRGHRVETSPSGLVTVTGGKLTTYRQMAADAVDAATSILGDAVGRQIARRSPTARLRLQGADGYEQLASSSDGITRHLADRYGGEAGVIANMIERDPSLRAPLVPGTDYVRAEALYAARYEMVRTLDDLLARRTRVLVQARDASVTAAPAVASLVAPELGWDDTEVARQVDAYRALAQREINALDS